MTEDGIGDRIRMARKSAGLTQEALAQAVGVRAQMIYRYERHGTIPTAVGADRLARACGVSVGWLITGEGEAPREAA